MQPGAVRVALSLLLAAVAALFSVSFTWAADPPAILPARLKIPAYQPGALPFHPGDRLIYRVSWEGLPVAFATIDLRAARPRPNEWWGDVAVSTNKVVDLFYRMRASLSEEFASTTLSSETETIEQHENRRYAHYRIAFDQAQGTVVATRRTHDHTEIHRYRAHHPLGPIAGALMALSQPLSVGDHLVFDVFAGLNRYVFGFDVKSRERLQLQDGTINTLRVVPTLLYLSAGQNHYKAGRVVVWIADNPHHTPVRIMADTRYGRIYVDLIGAAKGSLGVTAERPQ